MVEMFLWQIDAHLSYYTKRNGTIGCFEQNKVKAGLPNRLSAVNGIVCVHFLASFSLQAAIGTII